VSALLTASRLGYDMLRLAGADYLLALAAAMLWRSWRQRGAATATAAAAPAPAARAADAGKASATETARGATPAAAVVASAAAAGEAAGSEPNQAAGQQAARPPRPGLLAMWSRCVLTNLLNPMVGVFYVVVLPQFIPARSPHLLMGLTLAGVHDIEGMIWFTALITAAHRGRRWLSSDRVKRAIDPVTGTVLIAFGLMLAFSRS
jgi:threonine/homoserine/homoserine lactone efflux protein